MKKPDNKLIEGKYSHKYLMRLIPSEGKALKEIMDLYNEKTFTGASIIAMLNYVPNKRKILALTEENNALLRKIEQFRTFLQNNHSNSKDLENIKKEFGIK